MSNKLPDVPQADSADAAHLVASTLIGLIPFVGGADLFKFIISPSLDKRRERWMQLATEAIRELQAQPGFTLELLRENEEFTTLLMQTTQAAYKTHLEEKHLQLKNAIKTAILFDALFDLKQLYISLIDRLTPTHISTLQLINDYAKYSYSTNAAADLYTLIKENSEVLNNRRISLTDFISFLTDLQQNGLIETTEGYIHGNSNGYVESILSSKNTEDGSSINVKIAITELGNGFMKFIEL